MAIVLRGPTGDFTFNNKGWGILLKLAFDFGWRPRGTHAPAHWQTVPTEWSPNPWNAADYFTGRGQIVTPKDAAALADALAGAMDDIPNHDPFQTETGDDLDLPGYPKLRILTSDRTVNAFEVFGGVNKPGFREFVVFCRKGQFAIW